MATLQQLETALRNADAAGDMDAARQLAAVYQRAKQDPMNQVPDNQVPETMQRAPEPTLGEQAVGAGETALALGTGATSGAAGMIGGTLKGLAEQILSGKFGTQDAANAVEQAATQGAEALTYAPRTQAGQEQTQAVGEALAPLAGVAPMTAELGMIGQGAKASLPAAGAAANVAAGAVAPVARAVAAPVVSAAQKLKNIMPGAAAREGERSAGAAGTGPEAMRRTQAESLPVPVQLTQGAASRDAGQLAFEKEQIKGPLGAPLIKRAEENNLQAMQNFDSLIDMAGAEGVDLISTGNRAIDALGKGWKQAKNQTNAAYTEARKAPEAQNPVDLAAVVKIGEGDNEFNGNLIGYLNSKPTGIPSSAVTDSVRQYAQKLGIATEDAEGNLVPGKATVADMEGLRREVTGTANRAEPSQLRDETILKKLIDAQTDPVAGDLYKKARSLREKQARKFENRAVVANLITNRRGMDDPKVAADQVLRRSILNASPDEVTFLKRVMNTSGEEGKQAWKDMQGALINHIREESSKGLGMDSSGRQIISPAKLNNIVNQLDRNDRLDLVLGTEKARIVRDLNDVVKYVNTVPPGTLINSSGTAGALMAAMAEAGATGALTGLPVPVVSVLRALGQSVKNAKLKAKIKRALGTKGL